MILCTFWLHVLPTGEVITANIQTREIKQKELVLKHTVPGDDFNGKGPRRDTGLSEHDIVTVYFITV